jgi:hypothetical protein
MREAGSVLSDLGDLFAQAFRLMRERPAMFAGVVAVLTASGVGVDLASEGQVGPMLILAGLLGLYLQLLLNASALELDPIATATRRFAAMFGQSVVLGLAVGLGLLLAVVPAMVLLVRWSISVPVLLVEKRGVYESLRRSWELTAGRWGLASAVTGILIIAYGPQILLSWLTAYPTLPVPSVLAVNFYTSLLMAFQWLLCAALYRRIRSEIPETTLPQIFS